MVGANTFVMWLINSGYKPNRQNPSKPPNDAVVANAADTNWGNSTAGAGASFAACLGASAAKTFCESERSEIKERKSNKTILYLLLFGRYDNVFKLFISNAPF